MSNGVGFIRATWKGKSNGSFNLLMLKPHAYNLLKYFLKE